MVNCQIKTNDVATPVIPFPPLSQIFPRRSTGHQVMVTEGESGGFTRDRAKVKVSIVGTLRTFKAQPRKYIHHQVLIATVREENRVI